MMSLQFFKLLACSILGILTLSIPVSGFNAGRGVPQGKRYVEVGDGDEYNVFEHRATGFGKLTFATDSGKCETTPKLHQYSGYFTTDKYPKQKLWFWFFEARTNPKAAPLGVWVSGQTGCSSMAAVFQEHGPCYFGKVDDKEPTLNFNSWNVKANMLYVDQPVSGTFGFSQGSGPVLTNAADASNYMWLFMQAFYAQWPDYHTPTTSVGLFSNAHGGHFASAFALYALKQNAAIDKKTLTDGLPIHLTAVGINNALFNFYIQEREYIKFITANSYGSILKKDTDAAGFTRDYNADFKKTCVPAIAKCTKVVGQDKECGDAYTACHDIDNKYKDKVDPAFYAYDIQQKIDPAKKNTPWDTYTTYLLRDDIVKAIGAEGKYAECSPDVYSEFEKSGDFARNYLPTLSALVQSGIQVLLWNGDSDSTCNWFAGFSVAEHVQYDKHKEFKRTALQPYKLNGKEVGMFKQVGNFAWLKVEGAGQKIAAYKGDVALQVFSQWIDGKGLKST